MKCIVFLVCGLMCGLCPVLAAPRTLVEEPGTVLVESRTIREWKFPAVSEADGRITLSLLHRIDYPRAAGWCRALQIEVNGEPVVAAGTQVILYANAEPSEAVEKMPDLRGLSYSIARQRLGFYGLFINTNVMSRIDADRMLVSWQSVETDEEVKHGTVITVSLVDSDSSMDGRY